ncbi:dihydrofolate reductase family protein [Streptomyces sp. HNM0574]|uniref:dihydrofolate reductase family protein n=1 Tax=Streptomyces sp. HNM0574 TaxID=2714954 RepID=UPI00146B28AF|nr:dihydrofolate reductase family protein [Streptomyces sp. HNM0574]NLU65800.1 dihydrofolate reductase family protein [Streptomyces sp. HNM0574]
MKLTLTLFLTLDGVFQGPGGPDEDRSGGFTLGGWVVPYLDEDFNAAVTAWFARADAFLLGRRTYEIFAGYWPKVTDPDDPVAGPLNALPKYVASSTLTSADWEHAVLLEGDSVEAVRQLKQAPGRELQIHGSGTLARTLLAHQLIDEYRLLTFPVVLGHGKHLFTEGTPPTALKPADSSTTSTGVRITTYHPAGAPEFGTVGE